MKFDKAHINKEAAKSLEQGYFTEELGKFLIEVTNSRIRGNWPTLMENWLSGMIDAAIMRVLEEFLDRYDPEKGDASTLIISLVTSAALNKLKSYNWKDELGENNKTFVQYLDEDGNIKEMLVQATMLNIEDII